MLRAICMLLLVAASAAVARGDMTVRGNQLLDSNGRVLKLRGINWFGFNNKQTMVDGLWAGKTSLTQDFATVVYRMQLLGFNAVRLPFSFKDFDLPARDFYYCQQASTAQIRASVIAPGQEKAAGNKPLPPPRVPLTASNGNCNNGMPRATRARFLWVINLFARAGFKVVIDNHVWLEDPTAYENPKLWASLWTKLVQDIIKDPVSKAAVMFDLVNEPDNKLIFWDSKPALGGRPALKDLYLSAMDSIYKVHRGAIFVLEGTGQIAYGIPPGDGFVTSPSILDSFKNTVFKTSRYTIKALDDPRPFMQALMTKPYAQNVIWGPHFYAQSIIPYTIPPAYIQPPGVYKRMSDSFGYLTKQGYCGANKRCLKWPVLIGEFSAPNPGKPGDVTTLNALLNYINNAGPGNDGRHAPIDHWFFWCWNDNSPDTNGGIVKADWATIDWNKVNFLRRIGLKLWYE